MLQLEYLYKRLSSSYFWSLFFLDFWGNIVLPRKCGMVTWKIPGSTSHNFQAPVQTKPSGNSASWFRIFSDNLSTSKLVGSSRVKTSGFFKGGRVGTANGKLPWLSHEWAMKRAVPVSSGYQGLIPQGCGNLSRQWRLHPKINIMQKTWRLSPRPVSTSRMSFFTDSQVSQTLHNHQSCTVAVRFSS